MAYNIGSIETLSSGRAADQQSVQPLLEVLRTTRKIRYVHRRCETEESFAHHLKEIRRLSSLKLIYIAAHGTPFTLHLSSNEEVTIEELEELMKEGFEGRVLHLGACRSVLSRSETRWQQFLHKTEIAAVSGYSGDVDWVESAALELLWFAHLYTYSQLTSAIKSFFNTFPDLCAKNRFQVFQR